MKFAPAGEIDMSVLANRTPDAWWRHQMDTFSALLALPGPHKGQWRGALMFSLIGAWINGWVNNRQVGDLRCHRAHFDFPVRQDDKIEVGPGVGLVPQQCPPGERHSSDLSHFNRPCGLLNPFAIVCWYSQMIICFHPQYMIHMHTIQIEQGVSASFLLLHLNSKLETFIWQHVQ